MPAKAIWQSFRFLSHANFKPEVAPAERAVAALQKLLSIPYAGDLAGNVPLTRTLLRLDPMFDPMFDPLRGNPRFEKLLASGAPDKPKK